MFGSLTQEREEQEIINCIEKRFLLYISNERECSGLRGTYVSFYVVMNFDTLQSWR